MVLRFEVNQAEAFRQGVDVPKSTNHLDVNPAELSQEDRNLIADRLNGIDVTQLVFSASEKKGFRQASEDWAPQFYRIVAKLPTLESLMEAIRANQAEVDKEREGHRR